MNDEIRERILRTIWRVEKLDEIIGFDGVSEEDWVKRVFLGRENNPTMEDGGIYYETFGIDWKELKEYIKLANALGLQIDISPKRHSSLFITFKNYYYEIDVLQLLYNIIISYQEYIVNNLNYMLT